MKTGLSPGESIKRFAPIAACPDCGVALAASTGDSHSLACPSCDFAVRNSMGVLQALPSEQFVPGKSASDDARLLGWAQAIATDMDEKGATYASKYERYSLKTRGYVMRRDLALDLVGSIPGRVLEAGCGPGVVAPLLARSGSEVHGVDLSIQQLRIAASRDAYSIYVQGDLQSLPYLDDVFDTVIVLGVFEYLEQPLSVVREIQRVTRPGGQIVLSLPNAWSIPRLWTHFGYLPIQRAWKRIQRKPVPGYSRTLYSSRSLSRLLRSTNLRVAGVQFFNLVPIVQPFDKPVQTIALRLADTMEKRLRGFCRRALADQFLVHLKT